MLTTNQLPSYVQSAWATAGRLVWLKVHASQFFQICIPHINRRTQMNVWIYIWKVDLTSTIQYSFTVKKTWLRNKNNHASNWHFWHKTNKMWNIYNICLQSLNAPSVKVDVSANPDNENGALLFWYCLLGIAQINHVWLHLHLTGLFPSVTRVTYGTVLLYATTTEHDK